MPFPKNHAPTTLEALTYYLQNVHDEMAGYVGTALVAVVVGEQMQPSIPRFLTGALGAACVYVAQKRVRPAELASRERARLVNGELPRLLPARAC